MNNANNNRHVAIKNSTDSAEQPKKESLRSSAIPALLVNEAEWPLPCASPGTSKRSTRINLGPNHPTNISALPTSTNYGKQNSSNLPPEPVTGFRISAAIEPFDICFSSCPAFSEHNGQVLRPGMVLLRRYIPLSQQVDIVMRCRELGLGSGGFYRPGYNDGAKLSLHMMCLGLDWDPQTRRYGKIRHYDNSEPPQIPPSFDLLVRRAVQDARILIKQRLTSGTDTEQILPAMCPDICIVNFYTTKGRLGLHQDRDESRESLVSGLPVVSFSIGDSAEFLYGDHRDVDKAERILLESGDVLIFGGKSRHIFHGVTSIIPKTAPPALLKYTKLRPGRLNLTFRKY